MALEKDAFVASAIGLLCATLLYGVYFAIFTFALSLVMSRRKSHPVDRFVAFGTWLLFPLCVAHIILQFASFCNVLFTIVQPQLIIPVSSTLSPNITVTMSTGFNGPYFSSAFGLDDTIPLLTLILPTVGDVIGDVILLYRCWILWGRKWTVIFLPSIAVVSSTVGMFTAVFNGSRFVFSTMKLDMDGVFAKLWVLEITAFTLPLLSHVVITSLIVGRLYWTSRTVWRSTVSLSTASYIRYVIVVLIESGFLYVITQLALLVLFLKNSAAFLVVLVAALPVYAIAPTLILLRISLTASTEGNHGIPTPIIFREQLQEHGTNWDITSEGLGQFGAPLEKVLDITRHSSGREVM